MRASKKAIKTAILNAEPNEIILIAGKGHENYQLEKGEKSYFNDLDIVKNFLENVNE